ASFPADRQALLEAVTHGRELAQLLEEHSPVEERRGSQPWGLERLQEVEDRRDDSIRSLRVPRVEGHQRLKRLQLRPQEGPLDGGQPTFDEGRGLVHLAHGQCRRRRGPQRLWGRCSVQFGMLKPDLPGGSMIARYVAAGELKRDGSTRQQVLTEVTCELVC